MGDCEGVLDGDHVVVVEHGAAGFGLEDHDAMPAKQGRDLLEDVAHRGVAVAVELVFAALGDDVDLVHDGGDGADQAAPRGDGRQRRDDFGGGDRTHAALPSMISCTRTVSLAYAFAMCSAT